MIRKLIFLLILSAGLGSLGLTVYSFGRASIAKLSLDTLISETPSKPSSEPSEQFAAEKEKSLSRSDQIETLDRVNACKIKIKKSQQLGTRSLLADLLVLMAWGLCSAFFKSERIVHRLSTKHNPAFPVEKDADAGSSMSSSGLVILKSGLVVFSIALMTLGFHLLFSGFTQSQQPSLAPGGIAYAHALEIKGLFLSLSAFIPWVIFFAVRFLLTRFG